MAFVGKKAQFYENSGKNLPKPEEFEVAPSDNMTVRQQVSRSNLPLETKAAILAALEKPQSKEKKSQVYKAIEARMSDAMELTNATLDELEKVVQDALRAKTSRIAYQKVYRNGELWKVVPKAIMEPDHAMRLRVLEIFMKPLKSGAKTRKQSKRVEDVSDTAGRLRDREVELEGGILDGNGNGDRE